MNDRVFIDSNIFLYAFSQKDNHKQKIAKDIVTKSSCISIQVINEVSKNLLYKFGLKDNDIIDFINDAYNKYEILDINQEVFIKSAELRSKYSFSYYDSIIVATAYLSDCNILYSEDMQNNQVIFNNLKILKTVQTF